MVLIIIMLINVMVFCIIAYAIAERIKELFPPPWLGVVQVVAGLDDVADRRTTPD